MKRPGRFALAGALVLFTYLLAGAAAAAPYAAMVIDARSGEVLHSRNADTRLHPASLTKMMTLYVVFDAVERGEITLDTPVRVSRNAASEPPSKLYLKEGQRIRLRYLIRASAVKSANDAATAMAEAISGSEAAFADRMTRTARALGMNDTTFKNAHGLTESGHLSTARDMTTMGRALFYHFPAYYHLFSRNAVDAGGKTVYNTNRKLLAAYRGADGIKTGYTRAAGSNLVASAERGSERVIATMFGGSSSAARNARVAELLDMGFQRAPTQVALNRPARPDLTMIARSGPSTAPTMQLAVARSDRPLPRPVRVTAVNVADVDVASVIASTEASVEDKLDGVAAAQAASTAGVSTDAAIAAALVPEDLPAGISADDSAMASAGGVALAVLAPAASAATVADADTPAPDSAAAVEEGDPALVAAVAPPPRPAVITFSTKDADPATPLPEPRPESVVVAQVSASNVKTWGIHVGTFASRYEAERILLRTALMEIDTLDAARRLVVPRNTGFAAEFTGLDAQTAALACQRLSARQQRCETLGP
ncbi:D-alanyl-D-alanine carboxypeptidase family protein [Meridianimarinicoccus sp. RP-17]|uniref:D-alanyl-D-alanine carboxypeptidase family protein n=1 Tax=Meridianimarinicoccus zhengii TaxID=2056810 RepID=UPI000DAC1A8A|nr:D-alanyl-D-alanine carboxypeptidase family protein [Phycocomes zhengii]